MEPKPAAVKLALVVVLSVQAALLVPWLFGPGTQMDEGGVLAYAGLVFHGYLPMRDVRAFYGPLNPYVVGGLFKVVGAHLYVERLLGLAYRLVLAGALLALVGHRGTRAVVGAGALLALLPPTYGLNASASRAALAATCVAVLLASRERPLAAGAAAGVAVLMRYDWILPVALASLPWLVYWPWRTRLRACAGVAAVASLYVPYLGTVGARNVRFSARLLRVAEPARSLPIPHWPDRAGTLLDVALIAVVALLVVGLRRRRTSEGRIFLSVALLTIGLLPYVTSRADRVHILTLALAPVALFAAVLPAALDELRPYLRARQRIMLGLTAGGAVVIALGSVLTLLPPKSYAVRYHGRFFLVRDRQTASAATLAVRLAGRLAPARGRLFVGPADLRRTIYSDAFIYYLLPALRPATFFIALDPGVTNFRPHRLADELPHANVLILNRAYDAVTEHNASAHYGTAAPNLVVARDFCERGRFGTFLVYSRCHR